jgi:peptidyl-prolyl cis-trans isomerase A (cyclophilin A)
MKLILRVLFTGAIFVILLLGCGTQNPRVLIKTELGDIEVEIFMNEAPKTATNFLKYVDKKLFDGGSFYRVVTMDNQPNNDVKIEVIQGGLGFGESDKRFPPIEHETTDKTGIMHKDGVISMARNEPGSASSEIFICINDHPELDFGGRRNPDGQGFSAFGKVIEGMDVVRKIQIQPTKGQMLNPKIKMYSIARIE